MLIIDEQYFQRKIRITIQYYHYQQLGKMNELYDQVEAVIKTDQNAAQSLICKLEDTHDPQMGTLFGCPTNLEYVLKRLINASLSVDEAIKERSVKCLGLLEGAGLLGSADHEAIYNFVIEVSNYKKHALKKSEGEGFALGRILVLKALFKIFLNNIEAIQTLLLMMKDFPHYEQQIMEVCFLISSDAKLNCKLQSFTPQNKSSKLLHTLFLNHKNGQKQILLSEIEEVIQLERSKYPQKSVVLQYLGKWIVDYISPKDFFSAYAQKFLTGQNVQISQIYYILVIYKYFLGSVIITKESYKEIVDFQMIIVWLDQFRVLNKRMKSLANSISILFENDASLAFDLLESFHQNSIYLQNVSIHHPFHPLYQNVAIDQYWKYLYELCITDEKTSSEEYPPTHYHELTYFIVTRQKEIKKQQIATSLAFLISKHSMTDKKQLLYLVSNIVNNLWKKKKKKTIKFNLKAYLIITKIPLQNCNFNEQFKEKFEKCLKWLRLQTAGGRKGKEIGEETDIKIHFWNFYLSMLYFALIYPEEINTCEELEMVEKNFFIQSEPKKKVKKENSKQKIEKGKPVSVLTDIFVSLMTRPLQFLRSQIHTLYVSILSELDQNDIASMITVLATPDAEFIQEI